MAFESFYGRNQHKPSSGMDVQLNNNWEDVICPICLDFPHNCVLLQCASHDKGCRSFVCDTDHLHSNCLDRFKKAHGMMPPSTTAATPILNSEPEVLDKPTCPLCRGEVIGWVVVDEARLYLDEKQRCCEEEQCAFKGTYLELQLHAQLEHPHARPSKIDPVRQLDWENFQQSTEIIDVLSTIHSEVPRGVVLGDYVIEYGDDDTGDEFEDFTGDEGNWWTSCILYQVFGNFRNSRNRRRTRVDEGSVSSIEYPEYSIEEPDDEYTRTSRWSSGRRRSRRRRSRFYDN